MLNKDGSYEFRGFTISPTMVEDIRTYIDHGVDPGNFLSAVICNNLKEAVGRADDADMAALPAFVAFFYNEAPSACWGSLDKMTKYMAAKAVKRTGL